MTTQHGEDNCFSLVLTLNRFLLNTGLRTVYIQIAAWAIMGSEGTLYFPTPAWFSAATLKM